MNTPDTFSQEVVTLAQRIFARHCQRMELTGEMASWERIGAAAREQWSLCALWCLEEKDVTKDLLVQAVAAESKHRQEWQARAEKAEKAFGIEKWERNALEVQVADLKTKVADLEVKLANRGGEGGIVGQLIHAGNLAGEKDMTGLTVFIPWEHLRDAKRIPLYRMVRVLEVLP